MMEYFVIRLMNKADGSPAVRVSNFATEVEAWKEFYRFCGLAVDSENLTDAVMICSKQGFCIDYKYFEHEAPAPAPETPEE